MSIQRTDASSTSFGRRLVNAERDAAQAKADLVDLKQSLPNSQALQSAALTGEVLKQQRKSAKQAIARNDISIDELNSINPDVLTPAFQEQLRTKKRDLLLSQELQKPQMLQVDSPAALARFENWRQHSRNTQPQQKDFATNNLWPQQESPFQKWDRRMNSTAGRTWNEQQQRAQYDRDMLDAKALRKPSSGGEPQGKYFGGVRSLNDI